MSIIPDYNKMKHMIAEREAENMDTKQLINILYYGLEGYKYDSNENVIENFCLLFDAKDIPKIDFNQEALKNEDKRIERGDPR